MIIYEFTCRSNKNGLLSSCGHLQAEIIQFGDTENFWLGDVGLQAFRQSFEVIVIQDHLCDADVSVTWMNAYKDQDIKAHYYFQDVRNQGWKSFLAIRPYRCYDKIQDRFQFLWGSRTWTHGPQFCLLYLRNFPSWFFQLRWLQLCLLDKWHNLGGVTKSVSACF